MDKLKQKWQSLQAREQLYLKIMAVFIVVLVGYYFLVAPLSQGVATMKQQLSTQQSLFSWMQPRVLALKSQSTPSLAAVDTIAKDNLLSVIDTRLKQSDIATYVGEINQTANDEVRVSFESVPFDELMSWLLQQQKRSAIKVADADIEKATKAGMVKAIITLTV